MNQIEQPLLYNWPKGGGIFSPLNEVGLAWRFSLFHLLPPAPSAKGLKPHLGSMRPSSAENVRFSKKGGRPYHPSVKRTPVQRWFFSWRTQDALRNRLAPTAQTIRHCLLWEVNFSPLCCGHCVLGEAARAKPVQTIRLVSCWNGEKTPEALLSPRGPHHTMPSAGFRSAWARSQTLTVGIVRKYWWQPTGLPPLDLQSGAPSTLYDTGAASGPPQLLSIKAPRTEGTYEAVFLDARKSRVF